MHVAGVVATDPTMREFDDGRKVMSFRVASTSRRFDSGLKEWVDGPTLWVKVSCWRELAVNAAECVRKRDRVVVWGRVRSEQWTSNGSMRSDLALEAEAMGHDLAFGVSVFERKRRAVSTRVLTTDAGTVDVTTGELADPELPAVPPGLDDEPAFMAGTADPGAAGRPDGGVPRAGDDDGDDLEDDLEDDDEEVSLLAPA